MTTLSKNHILDAALPHIIHSGIRRFSLSALADQLGVVKSAFYHHFPKGKSQLIHAVFEREETRIIDALNHATDTEPSTRLKLIRLAQTKIGQLLNLARLYRVREEIADELQGFFVMRRRLYLKRESDLIADILKVGIERREIRPVHVDLAASAIQGALQHVAITFIPGTGINQDESLANLINLMFDGLAMNPARPA